VCSSYRALRAGFSRPASPLMPTGLLIVRMRCRVRSRMRSRVRSSSEARHRAPHREDPPGPESGPRWSQSGSKIRSKAGWSGFKVRSKAGWTRAPCAPGKVPFHWPGKSRSRSWPSCRGFSRRFGDSDQLEPFRPASTEPAHSEIRAASKVRSKVASKVGVFQRAGDTVDHPGASRPSVECHEEGPPRGVAVSRCHHRR